MIVLIFVLIVVGIIVVMVCYDCDLIGLFGMCCLKLCDGDLIYCFL